MFNPFHPMSQLERLISGHTKLADKARSIITKLEEKEKAAEDDVTAALRRATDITAAKNKAHKFLAKVEEFI